jgi:hypothetical protein
VLFCDSALDPTTKEKEMKAKLLSVAVALAAMAAAPPAFADSGPRGFQAGIQGANTGQAPQAQRRAGKTR